MSKNKESFFEVMRPNIKKAFLFFALAKICCFTVAPAFLVASWTEIIPRNYGMIGIAIYAACIIISLFYGLREYFSSDVPSRSEVERWMKYYKLESN